MKICLKIVPVGWKTFYVLKLIKYVENFFSGGIGYGHSYFCNNLLGRVKFSYPVNFTLLGHLQVPFQGGRTAGGWLAGWWPAGGWLVAC